MNAYATIRAALELATGGRPSNIAAKQEALAALAELERAAKEPVAWMWNDELGIPHTSASPKKPTWITSDASDEYAKQANLRPLYTTPPPAPVAAPAFEAVEVDDEISKRIAKTVFRQLNTNRVCADDGRKMIAAVRAELGPTLGLAVMREPTAEDCAWVYDDSNDAYETACGNLFIMIEGSPSDNGMKFCCYCARDGRRVVSDIRELLELAAQGDFIEFCPGDNPRGCDCGFDKFCEPCAKMKAARAGNGGEG